MITPHLPRVPAFLETSRVSIHKGEWFIVGWRHLNLNKDTSPCFVQFLPQIMIQGCAEREFGTGSKTMHTCAERKKGDEAGEPCMHAGTIMPKDDEAQCGFGLGGNGR
jgi:hypothetical protein